MRHATVTDDGGERLKIATRVGWLVMHRKVPFALNPAGLRLLTVQQTFQISFRAGAKNQSNAAFRVLLTKSDGLHLAAVAKLIPSCSAHSPKPTPRFAITHPVGRIVHAIARWHVERLRGNFFAVALFGVIVSFRSHAPLYNMNSGYFSVARGCFQPADSQKGVADSEFGERIPIKGKRTAVKRDEKASMIFFTLASGYAGNSGLLTFPPFQVISSQQLPLGFRKKSSQIITVFDVLDLVGGP